MPKGKRPQNLLGRTFGRLTVVELGPMSKPTPKGRQLYKWVCRCSCGGTATVSADNLRSGQTQSCGCLALEAKSKVGLSNATHGHSRHDGSGTPEYRAWLAMRQRCTNPKNQRWKNYGGRGIQVCDLWMNSFEAFLAHVGQRPSPEHSVDRYPNNDGNYEPGNVRWATAAQQAANRRSRWRNAA